MSTLQFGRGYRLSLYNEEGEGLVVEHLRLRFQLTKTLLGYPTRGTIEIYNLSEENIQRITRRLTSMRLEVGYAGALASIFGARIMNFYKRRIGTDSVFVLILSGHAVQWQGSVFSKTYEAGITPSNILRDVVGSFDAVITGNILEGEDWQGKLSSVTHAGGSVEIMNKLAKDYNFDWFIEENQINIVARGRVLQDRPVFVITPATGLIGSPTLTELGADFRVFLNPEIRLGREVQMTTQFVELGQEGLEFRKVRNTADGLYKTMDIRYLGDTHGNEWYCDLITWRTQDAPAK